MEWEDKGWGHKQGGAPRSLVTGLSPHRPQARSSWPGALCGPAMVSRPWSTLGDSRVWETEASSRQCCSRNGGAQEVVHREMMML